MSPPRREHLWLITLLACAVLLFVPSRERSRVVTVVRHSACTLRRVPRVVSHRGFDADQAQGSRVSITSKSFAALLRAGVSSFDLDLFWLSGEGDELYLGHPPSVRKLLSLDAEVHSTTEATLRSRLGADDELFAFSEFVRQLVSSMAATIGTISLELKFPGHPRHERHVAALYRQIARADGANGFSAAKLALVVESDAHVKQHRSAQQAAGVRVALWGLLRDADLEGEAEAGQPRRRRAGSFSSVSLGDLDGWSVSAKWAGPDMRSLLGTNEPPHAPVAVWTADDEPTLRSIVAHEPEDVVTNRPAWARTLLRRWQAEEVEACARRGILHI